MSEAICEECGKPKGECVCSLIEGKIVKGREQPTETIVVEHKFSKGLDEGVEGSIPKGSDLEKEELKAKLEQREDQLATIALKRIDKEKKALLDTISDPKKRKFVSDFIGEDPNTMLDRLQQVKITSALLGKSLGIGDVKINDGTTTPPPKGKARAYVVKGLKDGFAVIDKYYNILENPQSTQAEKDLANLKISEMIGEFVKGSRQAGKIVSLKVLKCPKCKNVMQGNTCQSCGYVMPRWERDPLKL